MKFPGLKELLQKHKINPKYLIVLVLGIFFMLIGAWLNRETKPMTNDFTPKEETHNYEETKINQEDKLQEDLRDILEAIDGIGKVAVIISFASSADFDYAVNRESTEKFTEEDDGTGGARVIKEKTIRDNYVVMREEGGVEKPLLLEEKKPSIQGILVVAEGAEMAAKRTEIVRALTSLLGVAPHRVTVLPGKY